MRINRELGADFDIDGFRHEARFDAKKRRVEMHLASLRAQRLHLLWRAIDFAAGESIHTESSCKHGPSRIEALAQHASWAPRQRWMNAQSRFALPVLEIRAAEAFTR